MGDNLKSGDKVNHKSGEIGSGYEVGDNLKCGDKVINEKSDNVSMGLQTKVQSGDSNLFEHAVAGTPLICNTRVWDCQPHAFFL